MKLVKILLILIAVFAIVALFGCDQACDHEYETTSQGPRCDVEVTNSKICSKCGDASYKTLPPTGHTFKETVIPADCTHSGYTEYTCDCGYTYTSDFENPWGHDFREIVFDPTCEAVGYTTFVCRSCDYSFKGNYIDPLGHSLEIEITDATCEKEGFTAYFCKKCDFEYISDCVKPKEHDYEALKTEPSCDKTGFTSYSCKNCDYSYDTDYIEPLGHSFASEVMSEANCIDEGEILYTCKCGYNYSAIIPPSGHDFQKTVTEPTVSDMGYTEFSCECGFTYKGNYRFYSDILDNAYANNSDVLACGIDISRWNHSVNSNGEYEPIDWVALKEAGVDFVILKIGSTPRGNDLGGFEPTFGMDYEGAKAAGLDVGVYYFTYSKSVSEIKQDAELLLTLLDGKEFEYPIYLDLEDVPAEDYYPSQIASPILTEMCLTFFSALQKEGYYTGLYVNNEFLFNIMQTENMIDLFEIWYARYPNIDDCEWNAESFKEFTYGENFGMWQYTMTGKLSPIVGDVDFNYAYKDFPTIIEAHGFNGKVADLPE